MLEDFDFLSLFEGLPILAAYCETFKNIIHSKCSSGHVERNFDNPARKYFARSPKKSKKNLKTFEKSFCSKFSSGHLDCRFDNTSRKLYDCHFCVTFITQASFRSAYERAN